MPSFKRVTDRPSGLLRLLLLGIALLSPLKLLGAEPAVPASQSAVPATPQTIPQTPKSDSFDSIEPSRDYLSGKITRFATRVDRFFGGDRHYQESNDSVFQLALTRLDGYGGDRRFDLTGRMNLRLPVTEGRLHLLIETDPEKNIATEPTKAPVITREKVAVPKSVALAARYATTQESKWHFSTDGGLKFPIPVSPSTKKDPRGSFFLVVTFFFISSCVR